MDPPYFLEFKTRRIQIFLDLLLVITIVDKLIYCMYQHNIRQVDDFFGIFNFLPKQYILIHSMTTLKPFLGHLYPILFL